MQQISSRIITPVTVVAAAAIDALTHLVFVAVKTVGFFFNATLFVVSVGNFDIHASLTPSQIFKHAYRAAVTVAFVVVAAPLSIFSSAAALSLAQSLGLAKSEQPKTALQAIADFWDGIPAGWNSFSAVQAKASYLASSVFNGVKSAVVMAAYSVKKNTVDSEHRNVMIAGLAVLALGYTAAAYQMGDALAPAKYVGNTVVDGANIVGSSVKTATDYAWSFVTPKQTWEAYFKSFSYVPGFVGDYGIHPAFWAMNTANDWVIDPVFGYTVYPLWGRAVKPAFSYVYDTAAAHTYVSGTIGVVATIAGFLKYGWCCKSKTIAPKTEYLLGADKQPGRFSKVTGWCASKARKCCTKASAGVEELESSHLHGFTGGDHDDHAHTKGAGGTDAKLPGAKPGKKAEKPEKKNPKELTATGDSPPAHEGEPDAALT